MYSSVRRISFQILGVEGKKENYLIVSLLFSCQGWRGGGGTMYLKWLEDRNGGNKSPVLELQNIP